MGVETPSSTNCEYLAQDLLEARETLAKPEISRQSEIHVDLDLLLSASLRTAVKITLKEKGLAWLNFIVEKQVQRAQDI